MQFPLKVPPKLVPRADFDIRYIKRLVFTKGLYLTWEQAAICPCALSSPVVATTSPSLLADTIYGELTASEASSREVSDTNPSCQQCAGAGVFWHSSQVIRGIVTGARVQPDTGHVFGDLARGEIVLSLMPEHLPHHRDRFTLRDSVLRCQEVKTRTSATVEAPRYPIQNRTLDLDSGQVTVGVLYAHRTDAPSDAVNGWTSPANGGLLQGTHFTIDANGAIDWTLGDAAGTAPVEGARYMIDYMCRPRYQVTDHPHVIRDTERKFKQVNPSHVPMPVYATARLEQWGG